MKVLDTRDDYLDYIKTLLPENPKVLEIGVEHGHFSEKIMKVLEPSELHLLDPWEWNPDNGLVYQEGHMRNVPTAHSNVNMQIVLVEDRSVDSQVLCPCADIGERNFDRLLHDLAQVAGDSDLPFAGHHGGLDKQNIAAGWRPGQAYSQAGAPAALHAVLNESRGSEPFVERICLHAEW